MLFPFVTQANTAYRENWCELQLKDQIILKLFQFVSF